MSTNAITPYSCLAKILKVPVFRMALGNDLISRIVIAVHNFFSRSFKSFDPNRAQRSIDRFEALGATIEFVTPQDGKGGEIQMMTFKAADLYSNILILGGKWERTTIDGQEVFAITPPGTVTQDWLYFKEKLSHFGWPERDGMLITCDCPDEIRYNVARCFLYAHSTSHSFSSDWKRAGFYLGAGQDLCFFDNGNTWKNSGRPPSEESFYAEIEAVYDKIKDQYSVDDLWIGGSCGGAPVAAHLKRTHPEVHFFVEQSFPDLDDFVKPIFSFAPWLGEFFAPRIKGSLGNENFHFGVNKLWKGVEQNGRCIFVQVNGDEHISEEAYGRYFLLANRVHRHVTRIRYDSQAPWHHADDFFLHKEPRREFMRAVFLPHNAWD